MTEQHEYDVDQAIAEIRAVGQLIDNFLETQYKELKEEVEMNSRTLRGSNGEQGLVGRVADLERAVDVVLKIMVSVFLAVVTGLGIAVINLLISL